MPSFILVRIVICLADVRTGIANLTDIVPAFGTVNEGTSGCRASAKLRVFSGLYFTADETPVTRTDEERKPAAECWPAYPQGEPWVHVVL